MMCHQTMLDVMVLITCFGQILTDSQEEDGCDNIHTCYNCEYDDYLNDDESGRHSHTSVDKESCRTQLTTGSHKQALYILAKNECILISKPDSCRPRYSETVDVVFLKTCDTGCADYTITKHKGSPSIEAGHNNYPTYSGHSSECTRHCFPVTQNCTVSYYHESDTCTVFPDCGESCLTKKKSSGVDVYTVTCNPVACPTLSDPLNGTVDMSAGTSPGALAEYSCNPGYNLSGSSVVICNSDGQWNDSIPSCTPVDCDSPAKPEFGSVSVTMASNGSKATYTCDTGYNISERYSRSCLANGSWELPEPKCVPVDYGPMSRMPSRKPPGGKAKKNGSGRLFIMPCICYPNKTFVGLTEEEIIQQLIADTKIEKKNTKLAVSKLISKPDPRVSSKIIGSVAIVVLSIIGGLILCSDIMTIRANRRALED